MFTNSIDWLMGVLFFLPDLALNKLVEWAIYAPLSHMYIAMGISLVFLILLIYSMIPRQHNMKYEHEPIIYYPTELSTI